MTGSILARYLFVMGKDPALDLTGPGPFIVRLWDGMDGAWSDVTGAISAEEALQVWSDRTNRGKKMVSFNDIDYFRIFHFDTRMKWSGDKEMYP